jgi:cytochrome c peroxidase
MTCHFPTLGTDDDRAFSGGVGGKGLGVDRMGGQLHPRSTQPFFNLHAFPTMFWDSRVEPGGTRPGHILTPAAIDMSDAMFEVFEFGVVSAQAMLPAIERIEMRGHRFTNAPNTNELAGDLERPQVWAGMMARLGAIPTYRAMFEAAYPGTQFDDMTFAHAANAIAGFEIRAFESRGSRFQKFLEGDEHALSKTELEGARVFFAEGCASCHSGPLLSDFQVHNTGLAQFGPGAGDGLYDNDDFGRAGVRGATRRAGTGQSLRDRTRVDTAGGPPAHTGAPGDNPENLFAFRTAPLAVNVGLTAPYGHAGQFADLGDFIKHYDNPAARLAEYSIEAELTRNEFFLADMQVDNSADLIPRIDPRSNVKVSNVESVVAFLNALTDPSARDLRHTIPASVPSGLSITEDAPPSLGEAHGTVTLVDIAQDPARGLSEYRRVPSARNAIALAAQEASHTTPMVFFDVFGSGTPDILSTPLRWRGMPGVAILDFDGDGDQDVFATNGPGAPNSLFANQQRETGVTRFVDRAQAAGVAATGTDNSGVCFGDIDNDGDHDLYVVADMGRSHFYRNKGDGTFEDISSLSGAAPEGTGGTSCAFGDINGDGRVDLFVARAWHQNDMRACFVDPFSTDIQPNELYLNQGGGVFSDISNTSGIRNLGGLPAWAAGASTITWAVSLVDYDLDGDTDIFTADDQCGLPPAQIGGIDRGFLQIFDNDGAGHFINRTVEAGTNQPSAWMGLSFGDFNADGHMDFFSPSFGDWGKPFGGAPVVLGSETSRWLLGGPGKKFHYPGVGDLQRMPFGWGTSARDFDNDGDTDLAFSGGMDLWFYLDRSNPGSMLLNNGAAGFGLDRGAFRPNHSRKNDSGVAAGDLNGDGFVDLVSVSDVDVPAPLPLLQYGGVSSEVQFYSVFDPTAYLVPTFTLSEIGAESPVEKIERHFSYDPDFVYPNGTMSVDLNSTNRNNWVEVRLLGSVGRVAGGRVNRDALGAVIRFTPAGGRTVMAPILGGSSHLSQDSLVQNFGLGKAPSGTIDILWPGGTRNRLYGARHREILTLPEIPCSYDSTAGRASYKRCVQDALTSLRAARVIDRELSARLELSATIAYEEAH